MCRPFPLLLFFCCLAAALPAQAATGRVLKVLPHFLDLENRHTLSPSLFDRDAYQAFLRDHTNQISGVRFDVHWKVTGEKYAPLRLRIELRGTAKGSLPGKSVLEMPIQSTGWFSHWTSLPISGKDYHKFGQITAWRVTLWEGDDLLGEQKSFLW